MVLVAQNYTHTVTNGILYMQLMAECYYKFNLD